MVSRDARQLPSSLRPALLLLAALGLLLFGLFAGSASATHPVDAPTGLTVSPGPYGSATSPSWTYAIPDGQTADCTLTGPDGNVGVSCPVNGAPAQPAVPLTTEGSYTFKVTTTRAPVTTVDEISETPTTTVDEGGTSPGAESTYVLDGTKPTLTVGPPTAGVPYAETSGWTVTASDTNPVTATCTLTPAGGTTGPFPCSDGSAKPALTGDGTYSLSATAVDAAGNASDPVVVEYVHDGTAPSVGVALVTSPSPGGVRQPEWSITVNDPSATLTCQLTGPSGTTPTGGPCAVGTFTAATLGTSGDYTLAVTATDAAGNRSTGSATYTLDVTPPTVTLPASSTGTGPSVSWDVVVADGVSTTCTVSGASESTATCGATGGTVSASITSDGTITLTVTAVDGFGNASAPQSVSYTRNTTPTAPEVLPDGTRGKVAQAEWTFTVDSLTTAVECQVFLDGIAYTAKTACDVFDVNLDTGSHSATLTDDGVYTLHVTASNSTSTNRTTGTGSYTLDTQSLPGPVITRTPSAAAGSTAELTWSWPVETGHTTRCQVSVLGAVTEPWFTCAGSSLSRTATVEGEHTLQVLYVDDLGNTGTISSSTYTYDTSAPATPTVTLGGEQLRQPGPVTWTWTAVDATRSECRVIGPGVDETTVSWGSCAMPVDLTSGADGVHTFEVINYDAAGNPSDAGTGTVTLDGTAPSAPTVTAAGGRTNASPLTWTLTQNGTDGVTFRCSLVVNGVAGPWDDCTSNYSHSPTEQGTHRLDVVAVDAAGNLSAVTQGATWTYDSLPPGAPAVTLETTSGSTTSATWTVVPAGAGTTQECRLTRIHSGGTQLVLDWTPCSSYTFALTEGDGEYVLEVRSSDDLGNEGPVTTGPGYTLDATAPGAPTVTGSRTGTGNATDLTYTWGTEAGGTASCRLLKDGSPVATYADCHLTSPLSVTLGFGDGSYRLEVVVTDSFGNVGAAGLSATYLLDTTAPTAPSIATSPPARTTATSLGWTVDLAPVDGGTGLECRLVRTDAAAGEFGACLSSYGGLTDGGYRLEVRSVDAAGNVSAVTTSDLVTVDTTAPTAPTVTLTTTSGNTTSATWTVTPAEPGLVECRLERTVGTTTSVVSDWAACAPDYTYALTDDGVYVLLVRSYDDLLNRSAATEGPGYTLDATAPAAPTVTGSRDGTTGSALGVTYSYSGDGTARCRLLRDGVEVTPAGATCTDTTYTVTLPTVSGGYRLEVTFTDAFGNVGAAGVSGSYVLDVTPPTVPAVKGSRDGQTDNELSLTYTYEGEGTAMCRLYRGTTLVTPTGASCSDTTYTVALPTTDGTYRLEVTFTDAYGNVSAPGVSGDYVLDVTPPGLATVTVTPRTDDVESATWTVTPPEPGTTTECQLRYQGDVLAAWHVCEAPYAYALEEGDGEYVLEVRVIDAVGNVGAVAVGQGYTVDMTPPLRPVVTSNRTVKDNERSVTYEFSGEGVATCQLTRDGNAVGDPVRGCTTGYTIALPDVSGVYVLVVTYEDAVGNVSPPGSSPAYDLDVTPPDVPVVTSDRTVKDNERVVTYTFSGEGSATCQLTRNGSPVGDPVACTSPYVVTLPTVDGEYVLLVTYTDAVGNVSAAGASPAYELDLTPPPAPVVAGPPPTGNTRTVTWTYSGEGTASCQLLLDGGAHGAEIACGATSFSTTLPSDGAWSLQVSFTDSVGNRGPPGTSSTYVLDTVAPVAPGVTGPTGPAQGRSPSWTVTAEAGTAVECRLLRAGAVVRDWTACSGSYGADLTGLPDGGYVVEARATDKAGNPGAVGSSVPYVLDTTAPLAPSVTGPAGPSQSRSPSFTWTGEPGTTAQCLLSRDGATVGGWVACSSGFTPALDRDGTWTVTVRLTDVAGNVGATGASGGYVLDTTPPPAPFVTPPQSPGRDLAPSWGAVVEGGTSLECRLVAPDGTSSGWAPCTLPHVTPLEGRPDGAYVLEVRATDAAGNLGPVGSGRYVLDTVAPAAAVVTSPAGPGRSRTPSFSFTTEPGSTTRCRLTSGTTVVSDYAPCTSPATVDLTGLPDGTYTLTVRVYDAAGNPGPAATGTYVLDTTGPVAPVATLAPGSPSADRTPTWAFSAEPGSTLLCRLTAPGGAVRDVASCTSPLTVDLSGQPAGSWTLTVRAVDAAGNVGEALTLTYVLDPTAIAGPDVVGPVSPGSSRTPRWTISTATVTECRLTLGSTVIRDWATCAGSFTADLFGKPDGTYALSVRTRTGTGAYSAATTSRYVLDTTAPAAATIVGPPTPSTNRQPTWSIASSELGATAECRVLLFGSVLRDWAACAVSPAGALWSELDLEGRGDGTYTLVVRLTDAAGNRGPEASSTYVLDTSAPVGVGVTGPPSPGNDLTPTWTFSSPPSVLLECRLTSVKGVVSDWDTCAGSYTADLTGLPDGTYTLAVRAVSAAGTPGPETTSAYVLSTEAPDGPTGLSLTGSGSTGNDRSPTWTFTLPTGTTGHCVVVQGARVVFDGACSAPFALDLSSAPDGSYTLTVTAVDAAGTESPGVSSTYVLDTVPTAAPVFTQVPGSPSSTLDPQWRFTVVYGATAECRLLLDGALLSDWAPCTSPYTASLTGRPDGRYVLEVRAVDAAGNSSPPKASAYVLDRTAAPIATFTSTPPTPSADRTVSWTLVAPDDGTLECRLVTPDGTSSWRDCASLSTAVGVTGGFSVQGRTAIVRLDLTNRRDGDYVLEVRVVEADGRKGSVSRATYTLDTRPPAAPTFSSVPPAAGNDPQPRWSWEATSDDRVECRLVRVDGGALTAWAPCTSPYEARLSADGRYALEIRVVDAAGNVSPVTSRAYLYDTTPPGAPVLTSRPPASGADRTVSWTFSVPQGVTATCTVTRGLSRVDQRSCSGGRYDLDLSGLPDGTYTLTIRFTDAAGNAGSPTTGRYALATVVGGRPGRVDAPSAPPPPTGTGGASPPAPAGPGRGGSGAVVTDVPRGSTSRPSVPTPLTDDDIPRSSVDRPSTPARPQGQEAAAPRPAPREAPRARNPLLADPLPVADVPEVLREAVTSTITKPTVPLTLLAIVILFLLAQNRIDRRDPKLASAPVEAEPELDFTTIVRRPGGAFS